MGKENGETSGAEERKYKHVNEDLKLKNSCGSEEKEKEEKMDDADEEEE